MSLIHEIKKCQKISWHCHFKHHGHLSETQIDGKVTVHGYNYLHKIIILKQSIRGSTSPETPSLNKAANKSKNLSKPGNKAKQYMLESIKWALFWIYSSCLKVQWHGNATLFQRTLCHHINSLVDDILRNLTGHSYIFCPGLVAYVDWLVATEGSFC